MRNFAEAEARYEKTLIRSPIEGIVLRKHHRSGESVSNSSTVPDPIVTIGDNSVLRVRVDVDETEVAQVRDGQPGICHGGRLSHSEIHRACHTRRQRIGTQEYSHRRAHREGRHQDPRDTDPTRSRYSTAGWAARGCIH